MPPPVLSLLPESASYSVTDGQNVIYTELDGGAGRYTLDKFGATSKVNVSWTLLPNQFQYLRAFYNTTIKKGSIPFYCDLIIDDPSPTQHLCYIIPGSMQLTGQRGLAYSASAQFEVIPVEPEGDIDETLVWLYEEYGDGAWDILDMLYQLVNEKLPQVQSVI